MFTPYVYRCNDCGYEVSFSLQTIKQVKVLLCPKCKSENILPVKVFVTK